MATLARQFKTLSLSSKSNINVSGLQPRARMATPARQTALSVSMGSGRPNRPRTLPGRSWKKYELNKNTGKPITFKLHVLEGDKVKVISGKFKGEVSTIEKVYPKTGRVAVAGVNVMESLKKSPRKGDPPVKVVKTVPIHHSNVMLYSEKEGVVSKVGHRMEDGQKVRYLTKTGETLKREWKRTEKPVKPEETEESSDTDEK